MYTESQRSSFEAYRMSPSSLANGQPNEARAPAGDPRAVASYVATMTSELTELARRANLGALAYFLDMARHEAQSIAGDNVGDKQRL